MNVMEKIKIDDYCTEISEVCNHPWKRKLLFSDRVIWNKLWSSIDTIQDTQLAIDSYLNLDDFNAINGGYLFVYGLMQALNIQQNAANDLLEALFNRKINYKKDYPDLYKIREQRNNAVGHPTKRGNDKSFHYINRSSVKKSGFELASYYPKSGQRSKFEKIDILNCIKVQDELIVGILTEIMEKLKSDFKKHKNKFKGERLCDLITSDFGYNLSKLYENVPRDYPLVKINFNIIFKSYKTIKEGINQRYSSIEALPGLHYTTQKLDYIFKRLKKDLIDVKIKDEFELSIFIDALKNNFSELHEMIKEIDEEFQ